ncbi:methyltransferase-like protein 4 [Tetranychus urticae]|uniref:Uncharacterized protein n=1 Tax=Tetranychus urticae TaxID=32264 RepID=T1KNF1_TETUR|nr:methyltransferase-like protein 4 [Tetranychus urticae]
MRFWTVDLYSIGINELGTGVAIVLDHLMDYWQDCGLKLDPALFEINLPFYMESERWWQKEDFNQKKVSDRQTYLACLSEKELKLIEWMKNKVNPSLSNINDDDNSMAKTKARQIHLRSSGINSIPGDKICSNLTNNLLITRIAFQNYIIPKMSCFIYSDVQIGLNIFMDSLVNSKDIIGESGKFLIIIDPPWENKSVKRKRNYNSQGPDEILQAFALLEKICKLLNDRKLDVRVALWTTQKYKQFCLDHLLPAMNMKLEMCLLWHKITKSWESSKIRGGREYLLIGSQKGRQNVLDGVLISIPSAIHSHKPPIDFNFPWLQDESTNQFFQQTNETKILTESLRHDVLPRLKGIELYARYLRPNFLSIGHECIKLQCSDIFSH